MNKKNLFLAVCIIANCLLATVYSFSQAPDFLWAKSAGGGGGGNGDYGLSIAVDGSGNSYVTGGFYSTITFGSTTLTNAGSRDIFIAKLNSTLAGIENLENSSGISVYPNPTSGKFNLKFNPFEDLKTKGIEIYNVLGEKIFATINFKQQTSTEIDLFNFLKGIYFVKIYDEEKIYIGKIVLQ